MGVTKLELEQWKEDPKKCKKTKLQLLEEIVPEDEQKPATETTEPSKVKIGACIVGGIITPLICLFLAYCLGVIIQTETWTVEKIGAAVAGLLLITAMLGVSTPHIAEAKKLLQWNHWQAWAFAVGLDFTITFAKFYSANISDSWIPVIAVWACFAYSAALNVWINLHHAGWSKAK